MAEMREQDQREAYLWGQQMKQSHLQQQCVITDEACAILAADFAQVYLFKSNQHITVEATHERAGLCMKAFEEGYRSLLS